MSDFVIDLRPQEMRRSEFAAEQLRFFSDVRCFIYEYPAFSLALTRADNVDLWGPYQDAASGILVALCGRVAFDDAEWSAAQAMETDAGGLACKAVFQKYQKEGLGGLHSLNGNFLVTIFDPAAKRLFCVTDRCGALLLYKAEAEKHMVIGTHPDVLAQACDLTSDLDLASLGEFLSTGKVSFPHTYYRRIRALGFGSVHTIDLEGQPELRSAKYFEFKFSSISDANENQTAERLADAFRKAVWRRTNPLLGQSAVSLSGGLDSRMILCAARPEARIKTFTFFDSDNTETRIAARIAQARGVEFMRMKRDPEHYGNSARLGVRILGGMGSLASNHYLGFRKKLRDSGFENILTGCYCDYFFKALALNRRVTSILRVERPSAVSHAYYRPVFHLQSSQATSVRKRLDAVIGERNGMPHDEYLLGLETRRLFPIINEPDSAQRGIPQRVLGWYLPVVDSDVLDVYLSLSPGAKFNARVYSKAVALVCGREVSGIPDANTGAAIGASQAEVAMRAYKRALENRYHKYIRPKLATPGSWPNWDYYLRHSPVIRELWNGASADVRDLLSEVYGSDPFSQGMDAVIEESPELFVRILTLKLWREACSTACVREACN